MVVSALACSPAAAVAVAGQPTLITCNRVYRRCDPHMTSIYVPPTVPPSYVSDGEGGDGEGLILETISADQRRVTLSLWKWQVESMESINAPSQVIRPHTIPDLPLSMPTRCSVVAAAGEDNLEHVILEL